jgi:hypothetical protein
MLQESWIEEESRVALTELTEFTGNTTQIDRHIGLLGIAGVTGMDTRVNGQLSYSRQLG